MATPVDPLKLIRAAFSVQDTDRNPFTYGTAGGESLDALTVDCTHISLPSGQPTPPVFIFPRGVETNYRAKRGSGSHYPLDAVCFLLERRDSSYTEYLQDARRLGLVIVSLTDKRELVEYLTTTETDTCAAVDSQAPLPVPLLHFPESPEGQREEPEKEKEGEGRRDPVPAVSAASVAASAFKPSGTTAASDTAALVHPVLTTAQLFQGDKDFSRIISSFKHAFPTSTPSSGPAPERGASSLLDQISSMNAPNSQQSASRGSSPKKHVAPWIIIVPAGSTSLLTLHNALDFLQEHKYVAVADARARGPKPPSLRIEHGGAVFEVIDNPARLSLADWSRVLACFALASTWQFKGWKWESPVELFQHVLGFHLYFDDVAVDATVAGWNVTRLSLSRTKRHLDATAALAFWNRVDDALKRRSH